MKSDICNIIGDFKLRDYRKNRFADTINTTELS